MVTLVNVLTLERATSKGAPDELNGTPPVGSCPYWPTVIPPDPCALTVIVPLAPVLLAVAVPVGLVLEPLAQPWAVGRPIPGEEGHGGAAVVPAATFRLSIPVVVAGGYSESVSVKTSEAEAGAVGVP